jgi:dolichol-phosphate mannosyltransferase
VKNNTSTHTTQTPPDLTIMLPAYAEAESLQELLPEIKKVVRELGLVAQILVVDTEKPLDNTPDVCQKNQVTYIPRRNGNRYGDAIRTGIKATTGSFVITMDSDGSHNPRFIRQLWENRLGADAVIASRYAPGGATDNPWLLVLMSRVLNVVFKISVGMPIYDISNSFRIYRGDLLRMIEPTYANFDVLEEILAKIIWGNFVKSPKIIEIPFRFERRKYGKPKRKLFVFAAQFVVALAKLSSLRLKHLLTENPIHE